MLDLSLNKQHYSGTDQNTAWEDNQGPDTPNKTSYFGFRVQSATKKHDESSVRSSINRVPVSQNGHRIQETICSEQVVQGQVSADQRFRDPNTDTFSIPMNIKLAEYCQS